MYESIFERKSWRIFAYIIGGWGIILGLTLAAAGALGIFMGDYSYGIAFGIGGITVLTGGVLVTLYPWIVRNQNGRRARTIEQLGIREPVFGTSLFFVLMLSIGWTAATVAICVASSWSWSALTGEPWLAGKILNTLLVIVAIALLAWTLYEMRVRAVFRKWRLRLLSESVRPGEIVEFHVFTTAEPGSMSSGERLTLSLCYYGLSGDGREVYHRQRLLEGSVRVTKFGKKAGDGIHGILEIQRDALREQATMDGGMIWYLLRVQGRFGMECFFELPVET